MSVVILNVIDVAPSNINFVLEEYGGKVNRYIASNVG